MARKKIKEGIKRKLYAESMGRCMNPNCQRELFKDITDIGEMAHIIAHCETEDDSYDNLILLCPNCHKNFDKLFLFDSNEVRGWKQIRKEELNRLFGKKYQSFEALQVEVVPLLLENKTIYENYYLGNKKELWDKFEYKILVNNRKLKEILSKNLHLIQRHSEKIYSNLELVHSFIAHVNEFENTRADTEKYRQILFPEGIYSMFGLMPMSGFMLPSTETLEDLITKLNKVSKFQKVVIGDPNPYIQIKENGKSSKVFLTDTPRLRQLYFDYNCPIHTKVRLESLNYALKYIRSREIAIEFLNYNNLREVFVNGIKIIFVYEYCLSEAELLSLSPEENSVIVNLHNWNGESCISEQAYNMSKKLNVTLLNMEDFYIYINEIIQKR